MRIERNPPEAPGEGGMEESVIETRCARSWLGGDGIMRQVILPGAEVALASVAREARQYYSGKEAAQTVRAVGLLVTSPLSRLIGNFFMVINKPPVPFRLFTSETEALEWLRGFIT
jgi:hypothetical protein